MGFSKCFPLLVATVFCAVLVKESESGLIKAFVQKLKDSNEEFDIKAALGGDGNIVINRAKEAIDAIDEIAKLNQKSGDAGKTIDILANGLKSTIKLVADAGDNAFDIIDNILGKEILDKEAALDEIIKGMDLIKKSIYRSAAPVHAALGAAKSLSNFADKGGILFAISKINEFGTALYDDLEAANFLVIQGLNADEDEVLQKCIKAAHSAILSAAAEANTNLIAAGKKAIEYLAKSDQASIVKHEQVENIISEKTKAAAAADSDTVAAVAALNAEFEDAIEKGISASILDEVKNGLLKYIEHCAWSVAIAYDTIAQAKTLAKTDPEKAIGLINVGVPLSKAILVQGSIQAYEGLGAAGRISGLMRAFEGAIEIAEKSRFEGTKGLDAVQKLMISGVKTGDKALDQTMESAHIIVEAIEAIIFDQLHEVRDLAFQILKPGMEHYKH